MSVLIILTLFYLLASVNGEPELIITRDNNGTETLVSSTIVAIKGDDVVLSCNVMDKGNPLTEDEMTWRIKTAKHEMKVPKSKLNIRAITRDKEGEYICFNTKYNLIKTMTVIVEPDKASELYGNFLHSINVNQQARVVTDENGEQHNDKDDYAFLEDDATQTKNDNLSNSDLESDEDELHKTPNQVKDNTSSDFKNLLKSFKSFFGVLSIILFVIGTILAIHICFHQTPVDGIEYGTPAEETTDPNIFIKTETRAIHYNRSAVYHVYNSCESTTFPLLSEEANGERSLSKQDHIELKPMETIPEDKSDSYYLYRTGLKNEDSSGNVSECDTNVSSDDTRLVSSDDN